MPPYVVHLHRRLARELTEVEIATLTTHDVSNADWPAEIAAELHPVAFGQGERAEEVGRPQTIPHEWRKGGRVLRWIREHEAAAVLVAGYNDVGRLRVLAGCRRAGIPTLLFGDSNITDDRHTGWRRAVKLAVVSRIVGMAGAVLACGSRGRAYFERYGADPARIFISPLEPDLDRIATLPQERIDRARFPRVPGRRRIIYSGRLAEGKRLDLLFDAFVAVAPRRPEWDLLVVGGGPLRASLEARLPESLRPRVLWTGFVVDSDELAALYRTSDVHVLPSDREAWGLVILEAAAGGLAIVTSDAVGAAPEFVHDGVNGRVFRRGDGDHLVECLLDATDPARTDGYRAATRDVLREWRTQNDPVAGFRAALVALGVIRAGA